MSVSARIAAALVAALAVSLPLSPPAPAADPSWRLEQPRRPGALFVTPLGRPGDLEFYAPNRGLLAVEGNAAVPRGLLVYDGVEWHQLATVCGAEADHARVAWAGPREFWVITDPSRPRDGAGTSLCRFRDGEVVASYSTPLESPDPYREMNAATCLAPDDCWFGGFFAPDATGERRGAFHLHWNGSALTTVYGPQGRGVTALEAHAGTVFEAVMVGRRPGDAIDPEELSEPEPGGPRLIHRIAGGVIANDPFTPAPLDGVNSDGTELLSLDGDGAQLWAGGGGAASGATAVGAGGFAVRPPLAARLVGDAFFDVPLDSSLFNGHDRFVDIAAVPGTGAAWAAVEPYNDRFNQTARARVARIGGDATTSVVTLPESGAGRGQAARIEFSGPNEGWMVTNAGWLFHYTDGTPLARDTEPAFQGTITFRPNEAAEQFVPDRPPVDDSELFKPPPLAIEQAAPAGRTRRLPALLRRVRTTRRGLRLIVRFTLVRRASVSLIARRGGRVVGRTRPRTMQPGRRSLALKLSRRRWPKRLQFRVREPGQTDQDADGGDTITTGVSRPLSTAPGGG